MVAQTFEYCVQFRQEVALSNPEALCPAGYGFVDFDSPAAAQKAVSALKTSGVQAQMAKVSLTFRPGPTVSAEYLGTRGDRAIQAAAMEGDGCQTWQLQTEMF